MTRRSFHLAALILPGALLLAAPLAARAQTSPVELAVSAPDRPAADTARDAARHPGALLDFAGVKPGETIADLLPGAGYFTRLFSHVAGVSGHVYAIIPTEFVKKKPQAADAMKALAQQPPYTNVTVLVQPIGEIAPPQKLDLAWTSDNYHDIYAFFGPDAAAAFDKAVFASLKSGGVFMVVDHVALPGTEQAAMRKLHRIDPAIVKAQVMAAGFALAGESPVLHNPADTHDQPVFAPAIKGHTDQFVFLFRKP